MKTCSKCKVEKPESDFSKRRAVCKECRRAYQKIYRAENREKMAAYRKENREEIAANQKSYRAENRAKIAAYRKENREKMAAYRKENRKEIAAYQKIYRAENRDVRVRVHKYGITPDDFKRMLAEQGGVCAICGSGGGKKRLCVDHDHDTGKVRGLLCQACNKGIGIFKDSSAVAQLAINYLKQHGK